MKGSPVRVRASALPLVLRLLLITVLVALGAVAGFFVADRTRGEKTTTVTVARTTEAGVPAAVAVKRAAMLRAARAKDYDALARLADPTFRYTFGSDVPGGPAAYWRQAEQRGEQPLEALAAVLQMPYTLSSGMYVWPFAYDKTADQITQYEAQLLSRIPPGGTSVGPEGYLSWRAGIRPDGSWIYFVAGD